MNRFQDSLVSSLCMLHLLNRLPWIIHWGNQRFVSQYHLISSPHPPYISVSQSVPNGDNLHPYGLQSSGLNQGTSTKNNGSNQFFLNRTTNEILVRSSESTSISSASCSLSYQPLPWLSATYLAKAGSLPYIMEVVSWNHLPAPNSLLHSADVICFVNVRIPLGKLESFRYSFWLTILSHQMPFLKIKTDFSGLYFDSSMSASPEGLLYH